MRFHGENRISSANESAFLNKQIDNHQG